jgi:outer membrane receptor for ferrienterochelin and colicins
MNVLYEGDNAELLGLDLDENDIVTTNSFFDMGLKLSYTIKLNGASVQFHGGVKNIFNSYQDDFDGGFDASGENIGLSRDPAYMYGPLAPRTIYFGIKFGNLL